MRIARPGREPLSALFLLGAAAYLLSILWINFHSGPWYNYDMYADAQVARLMAESRTLFPENWVFGNQYYVIATPALAALFYPLCRDSVLAVSLASSVMTLLILGTFVWCCVPFLSKQSVAVGLFCLAGAVIPADSAASNLHGLQLFYTMASYYACYLWGILFHLGIFLRLRRGLKLSPVPIVLALLTDLAFGMQSLRETLVLNIPLALLELLCLWRRGKNRRSGLFVLLSLAANLAGTRLIRLFPATSSAIVSPVRLDLSPAVLSERLSLCLSGLAEISGLRYAHSPASRKPLFLAALFIWLGVAAALFLSLRRRDRSPAAMLLRFSLLSLLCVFGVGVLLFNTRGIYFFVWFLLASLSFAYLAEAVPKGRARTLLLTVMLLCGMGVYAYHFIPDFRSSASDAAFYTRVADELCAEGVDTLYVDLFTPPTIAACSHDRITAGTFRFEPEDEHPLQPVPYLYDRELFSEPDPAHARIVLLGADYEGASSLDYLESNFPPAVVQSLLERLQPERTESERFMTYLVYRFDDPELFS